uniref:Uncharacterized protein n=2 Tax=Gammaproteobacteria TaxID=1236 RepID=W0RVW8_KLEPN|nr:hypothetical protein [Aeromonas hydrophila]AHG97087.1 hypothetical protein [Klebsiella pneumoniae]
MFHGHLSFSTYTFILSQH